MNSLSVTIQVKGIDQYVPVDLFIMLYKVVLMTIQMKTTEWYFPVVLFIILCKVVLIFESVNLILGNLESERSRVKHV